MVLKNIFLTASPFLITEIKASYKELKLHVDIELENAKMEEELLQDRQQLNTQNTHKLDKKNIGL